MDGKMVIFCAPSGAGKTSIVRALLPQLPLLEFSVSATSRPARAGEIHGKDYYFLTADDFRQKIQEEAFLEWEEVYPGSFYGTLLSETQRIWAKGQHIIFDVDVIGGLNIKKKFGAQALAVFVMPPSLEELKNRLQNRGTETTESLNKRLEKAEYEMSFAPQFDRIVVNENLEKAIGEALEQVTAFLNS